ncbi:MAG: SusE domain-containing protein [Bacteroidia bacterium]
MKNIFKFLALTVLLTGAVSCEDEQDLKFVTPPASFEILTPQAGESVILTPENENNPALSVVWTAVDYGTPTEVTYTVQVAKNGTDFATPIDVTSTSGTFANLNVITLNGAANAAGLEAFTEGGLDIRVKASVGSQAGEPAYSNVVTYLVTPYVTYPYTDLYLVGAAVATGWDNTSGTNMYPLFRSATNEDLYSYTGFFKGGGNDGQFKVIKTKGAWQPQYGSASAGVVGVNDGTGTDPNPFQIDATGYYTFTINLADNTYSITPYTASGSTYATIGLVGSATPGGWDADTDMTKSSFDPHIWYLNNVFLTAGNEIKFRANDGWDINWGGSTSYSGVGTQNGPNIPAGFTVSGNYDVWFNDLTGEYIYIPVN